MTFDKMEFELHEQILIYLYDNRYKEEQLDLYIKFNNFSKKLVYDKSAELGERGFIEIETNDSGIGWYNWDTGHVSFPNAQEPYLKAKIRNEGIQFVKNSLLKKTDLWNVFHKTVETFSLAGTVILGIMLYVREEKHNKTEELLHQVTQDRDKLLQQSQDLDNKLGVKDKEIQRLTTKHDSLTNLLTADKKKNKKN